MKQDLLNFTVAFYSVDGKTSPVLDYLQELSKSNPKLTAKALSSIIDLPLKFYNFDDIKVIKSGKSNYYELRVKAGSDICRFFFLVQEPNYIVLYGFTKKTQKTDSKDLKLGERKLQDYLANQQSITVDLTSWQRKKSF
jgi:phage-related protein